MADSSIEWTDKVWNPIRGCSLVSAGCKSCYAMRQAYRFSKHGQPYEGLVKMVGGEPKWTGDIKLVHDKLSEPLSWKKPVRIFVNSMSDLFHKDVPFGYIDRVFAVMAIAKRHTFQVLTKRPERMAEYLNTPLRLEHIYDQWFEFSGGPREAEAWPLPNVWLGTSCENQKAADERIPHLLRTPAAVRFLSCEPLLENVDLTNWLDPKECEMCGLNPPRLEIDLGRCVEEYCQRCHKVDPEWGSTLTGREVELDWVIAGGESGKDPRPCDLEWIRSIVSQCRMAGKPVFVKQLGGKAFDSSRESEIQFNNYEHWCAKARSWLGGISGGGTRYKQPERGVCVDTAGSICTIGGDFMRADKEGAYPVKWFRAVSAHDRKGGDMAEWPEDLRVRQFPTARDGKAVPG